MAFYKSDRAFTDYIHEVLAVPLIYEKLNWNPVPFKSDFAISIDFADGVDYVVKYRDQYISVQERFRESKYAKYNDFTIRYRRDNNKHSDRKESEFYKLKAEYLLYAVTNGTKNSKDTNTKFVKWALINLPKLYQKIETEKILVVASQKLISWIDNDRLFCPINYNRDGSSSFIALDIGLIKTLWADEIIRYSNGY